MLFFGTPHLLNDFTLFFKKSVERIYAKLGLFYLE